MSFLSYSEWCEAFPNSQLIKNEEEFNGINNTVSMFIADRAGITIPASPNDAPGWVKTPAAFLNFRFAALRVSNKSPEFISDSQALYMQALEIIDVHKVAPKSRIISGTINEVFSW